MELALKVAGAVLLALALCTVTPTESIAAVGETKTVTEKAGTPAKGRKVKKATAVKGDAVVLALGGKQYTADDFRKFYGRYAVGKRTRQDVFDSFVNDRVLFEETQREGYLARPLAEQERRLMLQNVQANRFIQTRLRPTVRATDDEISLFLPPDWEQVKLQMIIFQDNGATAAEAMERAQKGDDFSALVSEYSQFHNKREGYTEFLDKRTDYLSRQDLETVFRREKGDVAGIFHSELGYVILKVIDKRSLTEEERQGVREQARAQVSEKKLNAVFEEYLAKGTFEIVEEDLRRAVRETMRDGGGEVARLPVVRIDGEGYPFRIVTRMAGGSNLFIVQKDENVVVDILKSKCRELAILVFVGRDAAKFDVQILPEEREQIERTIYLAALGEMLAERISKGDEQGKYKAYLDGLKTKYNVQRKDKLVAAMDLPPPKAHEQMK